MLSSWKGLAGRIKSELLLLLRGRFLRDLMISDYIQRHMLDHPKYQDPRKLNRFEAQVFSQNGEDGILAEIFRRIGTTNRTFVEFGVGDGSENNTVSLLLQDWTGLWLEGSAVQVRKIRNSVAGVLQQGRLKLVESFLTRENIAVLFEEAGVRRDFDLLSIDIDGNDYYLWQALGHFRPRVVVIEYNAIFTPEIHWVMPYDAGTRWDHSGWTGASLRALFELGQSMGYDLVACNFSGLNAFFVRSDLVDQHFLTGSECALHYEPPRYFLHTRMGHPRKVRL